MPETSGRGAELLALSGYNGRAVQTKKERPLTRGNGSAGKTRIYFRPFEGAAAFAAVGPWREAFAGLPWVTVASTFVLFLARWSLREYLSGAVLPPAAFVISTSVFALLGVPFAALAAALVYVCHINAPSSFGDIWIYLSCWRACRASSARRSPARDTTSTAWTCERSADS
jgi:hypothetical protein